MTAPDTTMRLGLYPALEPFNRGRLKVSDVHELYYEECGNPSGIPALVLHGGPGGGISPFLRQLHDPTVYRIILFDQRGCGKSTPNACLVDNTTWHLVSDIEALRMHLGVARWHVLGGSWGSTLALAYALTHRAPVLSLVLRGIFTITEAEIQWFYQSGAHFLFPDAFESFMAPIPWDERHDLVAAHHRRMTGDDHDAKMRSARAWSQWEGATLSLLPNPQRVDAFGDEKFASTFALIEAHYFINKGFFVEDGWLLKQAHRLTGIPGYIIHGRYDVVTPLSTAYALHKAWPEAQFEIVADAGHTALEPGLADALIRTTQALAAHADSLQPSL